MLVHRENSLLPSSGGDPAFGAAYSVMACPVGARASQASSGLTITVDSGHSFRALDKCLIRPGSDNVFTAAISSVTTTTIVFAAESYSVSAGDLIVNMGPDTGTTVPFYDGSPMGIYSDADGGTAITYATVTCSSVGEYSYYHNGDGRFWELLRDGDGDVSGVVAGFTGNPGRYNVWDYGASVESADCASRIQATIEAAEVVNGVVYLPDGTFLIGATLSISERITFRGSGYGFNTGDGEASTIITKIADNLGILVEDGCHYTVLEEFCLWSSVGSGVTTNGIEIGEATATNGSTGVVLRRVFVRGQYDGIDVRNGNSGKMDTVVTYGNYANGVLIDSDNTGSANCNAWTLINPHSAWNGDDGISIVDGGITDVLGGDIERNGQVNNTGRGIYTNGSRCFIRSYAENNGGYDFECGSLARGGIFMVRTGATASKVTLGTNKVFFIEQAGEGASLFSDLNNAWTAQEGAFQLSGPNDDYDYCKWGMTQETITLSTGGATTDSAAGFLPANSYIEAVIAYVTTAITTAVSFSVGDASIPTRFINAYGTVTLNAKKVGMRHLEPTVINASGTWDPGSLADGAGETKSITATGAALGDYVMVSAPYDLQDMTVSAYVQAADTVEIRLQNESGGILDLASGTWRVRVVRASHDGPFQSAAAAARITCNTTPGAGAIRLAVFYRTYFAES